MYIFNRIKTKIYSIFDYIRSSIEIINKKRTLCRIEEINILKKFIIVHCLGVNAPIKLSFDDLISDYVLLSNLPPKQASWIGYYYGKYYNDLINNKHKCITKFDFTEESSTGKFKILMLNRKGDLIYTDKEGIKSHIISPINAMNNEAIIANFDPIQACYIGVLVGIKYKKAGSKLFVNLKNTHLRLIQ